MSIIFYDVFDWICIMFKVIFAYKLVMFIYNISLIGLYEWLSKKELTIEEQK